MTTSWDAENGHSRIRFGGGVATFASRDDALHIEVAARHDYVGELERMWPVGTWCGSGYRRAMDGPLLLYDADCGFCLRAAAWARVAHLRVAIRPMQSVDLRAVGVSPERAARELPLVIPDGRVYYGHEAVTYALTCGGVPYRLLGSLMRAPSVRPLARIAYACVSRHRRTSSRCRTPSRCRT